MHDVSTRQPGLAFAAVVVVLAGVIRLVNFLGLKVQGAAPLRLSGHPALKEQGKKEPCRAIIRLKKQRSCDLRDSGGSSAVSPARSFS